MCGAAFSQGPFHLCGTVHYLTWSCPIYDNYSSVCVVGLMTFVTDQNHDNEGTQDDMECLFFFCCFFYFLHVN